MKLIDLAESYSEGGDSTFTCPSGTYYVDDLIQLAKDKSPIAFKLSRLMWMTSEPADALRVAQSDFTIPIIVNEYEPNRWATLDGFHRVRKAIQNGETTILAKIVTNVELTALEKV